MAKEIPDQSIRGSMDVEISIREGNIGTNNSIKGEFKKDEGGACKEILEDEIDSLNGEEIWRIRRERINKVLAAARDLEPQDKAEVYAATRRLAGVIQDVDVEEFISAIEGLANQIDPSAIFNCTGGLGDSLLHVAVGSGKDDILRLLLDYVPAHLIAAQNDRGDSPLHLAFRDKSSRAGAMLIRRARDLLSVEDKDQILRLKNKHGNTALLHAVSNSHVDGVRCLLNEDLELVYWKNIDQISPLYLALDSEDPMIREVLYSLPLEPSRIQGLPPIHGAVLRNRCDLAAQMLEKNMKLFAMTDSRGGNLFHLAAYLNIVPVFELLRLDTEYLARQRDMNGDLPIHIASKMGYVELIQKLLPVSLLWNERGQTILHVAAKYGRTSAVKYILGHPELRMMINDRDHAGNTPSHLATMYSQPAALISLMLNERISPGLLNHECLTALDIALDRFRREPTLRKKLTLMVLASPTMGKTVPVSGELFVLRPEARDEGFSRFALRKKKVNMEYVKDAINTRLLVATLVATVTFAAGFAVPGGFNGSDTASKDDRGMATMVDKRLFQAFAICNTIAMFCSMTTVLNLNWTQQNDVEAAIAAFNHSELPLTIALPAMSVAFLTGVTLTVGKLPWLANTLFYLGLVFLLLICGAKLVEYPPLLQSHHRPIRHLIFWLVIAYVHLWGVGTYLLDDSEEDKMASGTSASWPPDCAADRITGHSETAKCGDAPHPPNH